LAVFRDGEIDYTRGYGMANLEYGIANASDTVFRIASTSKQFTAMAMALLAEQGKISLGNISILQP
jgi:CubicO group peptidase (beta-lactamase class C family)